MGRADGLHRGRNEGRFSGRGSIFDGSWRRGTWLRGNEGKCFRRQGPSEQRSRVRKVRDTGKEPVTESRRVWRTAGVEDGQEGSPPSLPSLLFLLHILRFRGLGPNVRTAVPTALTRCPARDHTGGSGVPVHGLMETPARLVWRKVGQEGHQGGVPLSFRAGYPQIAERQTSNRHRLAGGRNRLNIAARRQERHPVVIAQMGEGVGSEGNGKSRGEKVGRPQMFWGSCGYVGQNTHMVWMEPQLEHMVSAEEDATGKHRRGAWRRLFRSIKNQCSGCVTQGTSWGTVGSPSISVYHTRTDRLCDPHPRAELAEPQFPVYKMGIIITPISADCWGLNYMRYSRWSALHSAWWMVNAQ